MSLTKDEDKQQQQQQEELDRSSTEKCLPEWRSSDPILASVLRHLRATDQRLDGSDLKLTAVLRPIHTERVDVRRRSWCERAGLSHVFHIGVDAPLRP